MSAPGTLVPAASVHATLGTAADAFTGRTAVRCGATAWSYARLLAEVEAFAEWLDGERFTGPVLVVPTNTPDCVALVLGAVIAETVPLLADPAWTSAELQAVARRSGARRVIWQGALPPGWAGVARGKRGTLAWAEVPVPGDQGPPHPETTFGRFTSGTTGSARCLQFSDGAALAAAASWRAAAGLGPDDRVLCLATLSNGLAFNTSLLAVLASGGTLAFHQSRLLPGSLARTLAAVEPTVLVAFPFAYEHLARADLPPTPTLRLAVSSAAPLKPGVRERWAAAGLPICDYYGLAEVGPCTFNDGADPESVGLPLDGVTLRVTDDDGRDLPPGSIGRVRVRTSSMATAYLDDGPAFAERVDESGFYVTQDRGLLTGAGRLVLRGRVGPVLNLEGRKVDPSEVEAVLRALPGVEHAVVRGEPSGGRNVLAAYVESSTLGREDVVAHCRERLSPYKLPQIVVVVPALPRSSTGKVALARLPQTRRSRCRP